MSPTRHQASRSLLWSSLDTFSQTGFSIVALALLARWLGVADLGLGSLAVMIVQLVSMPFELLFHDALIQRKELHAQHQATAFTTAVLGACCAAGMLLLAAPVLAEQYAKPQLTDLLRGAALAIPIAAGASVISALLRRQLAFAPLARRTVFGRLAGVSIGVAVAFAGGGAWSLVVMYVASTLLSTLVLLLDRRNLPGVGCSLSALRELLRFGAPNMLAQLLLLGNGRIFVVVAGFYLSDVALGRFTLVFRLVEELRNTLSSAAAQLALPLLARRAHHTPQFTAVFFEATALTAAVLLPLYAGMAATATQLMTVVFGAHWQQASQLVQWMALAAMLVTLRQYSSIALNAMGRPGSNALINGAVFVFSLLALFSGWVDNAAAAAQVWVARAVLLLVLSVMATRKVACLSLTTQLGPCGAPLLAAVTMFIAVLGLQHTLLIHSADLVVLAVSIAAGVLVYLLALLAVSPQLLKQFASFANAAWLRHGYVRE